MLPIFLATLAGIYLHNIFPFSLLLIPLVFFKIKSLKTIIIFFVIGTIIFFPYAKMEGYHTIYGKVLSYSGKNINVETLKVDGISLKQNIIVGFSDRIYKTLFDHGDEVYFKGKIKKLGSIYYCRISTKDIGFLPSNSFFSKLKSFYLSKISKLRNKDIVSSLLLSYKSFNSKITPLLKDSGFSPIFAISGLHIGLIAMMIYNLFYFLSPLWKKLLMIFLLLVYIFLIGFPLSATRAVFMILLFLLFSLLDLPNNPKDTVSIVGILFLLYNPHNAYNAGFLMSFFGAIALIFSFKNVFISLTYLFLFIFPLTSFFFSKIFILSFLFQSFVAVPVLTVFLIVGILFLMIPINIFLPALDRLADVMYILMKFSAKLPVINYKFPITFVAVYYLCLFSIILYLDFKNHSKLQSL